LLRDASQGLEPEGKQFAVVDLELMKLLKHAQELHPF